MAINLTKDERDRIADIIGTGAHMGCNHVAARLAFDTDMSADDAERIMEAAIADAKAETILGARSGSVAYD